VVEWYFRVALGRVATVDRIAKAALRLFAVDGYSGASMEQV